MRHSRTKLVLEAIADLGEHRSFLFALDVRTGKRCGDFEIPGERASGDCYTGAGGGGRLASRHVMFPGGAEIIETVGGNSPDEGFSVREVAAQFDLRAEAAVAGNLRDFKATAQAVAADLEALGVGQHVTGVLRESIEACRPVFR